MIGIVLLGVATFLARESEGLLLGESTSPEVLDSVEKILNKNIRHQGLGLATNHAFWSG